MRFLARRFRGLLPLTLATAVLAGLLLQLEFLLLSQVEGSRLSVQLLSDSPLVHRDDLRTLQLDLDSTDLPQMQRRVLSLPWVRDAALRRIWPDQLQLVIEPRRPLAVWDAGHLLSRDGVLVPVPDATDFLHLGLPTVQADRQLAAEVAPQLIWLASRLGELQIGIRHLVREEWGALSIDTDSNQRIKLGSSDFERRLQHLKLLLEAGLAGPDKVSYIDLRYEGMLAVGDRVTEGRAAP